MRDVAISPNGTSQASGGRQPPVLSWILRVQDGNVHLNRPVKHQGVERLHILIVPSLRLRRKKQASATSPAPAFVAGVRLNRFRSPTRRHPHALHPREAPAVEWRSGSRRSERKIYTNPSCSTPELGMNSKLWPAHEGRRGGPGPRRLARFVRLVYQGAGRTAEPDNQQGTGDGG